MISCKTLSLNPMPAFPPVKSSKKLPTRNTTLPELGMTVRCIGFAHGDQSNTVTYHNALVRALNETVGGSPTANEQGLKLANQSLELQWVNYSGIPFKASNSPIIHKDGLKASSAINLKTKKDVLINATHDDCLEFLPMMEMLLGGLEPDDFKVSPKFLKPHNFYYMASLATLGFACQFLSWVNSDEASKPSDIAVGVGALHRDGFIHLLDNPTDLYFLATTVLNEHGVDYIKAPEVPRDRKEIVAWLTLNKGNETFEKMFGLEHRSLPRQMGLNLTEPRKGPSWFALLRRLIPQAPRAHGLP